MRGVWTALITPFKSSLEIDQEAFDRLLQDQRDAGITGVIPCGTTGEAPTLALDEKKKLIQRSLEFMRGSKTKVFAGTGSNNTVETIAFSKWASDAGVDGILVVTPYYNKPSPSGIDSHFRAVADAVTCEVMLYNVPGRTGLGMAPETIVKLGSHPRIRSIKEATANVTLTSEIIDQLSVAKTQMDILSGDDAAYLPLLSAGATGVVSVASNLFPRAMLAIQAAYEGNDTRAALALQKRWYPLFRDLFIESNPSPVKAAMAFAGWCEPHVRPPLASLTESSRAKLEATLKRCGVGAGRKPL